MKLAVDEKLFVAKVKLYFSGVSSRIMHYGYFNVAENTVVLCNSSTGRAGTAHGDRLMSYGAGELSFHILKFKDTEFFNKFREVFQVPQHDFYCIHFTRLNAVLGKCHLADLEIINNPHDHTVVIKPKKEAYSPIKHLIGLYIDNFHVRSMIEYWYQQSQIIGTPEHQTKYPHYSCDFNRNPELYKNAYIVDVDVSKFVNPKNQLIFDNHYPQLKLICYDGLSAPGIKSFISKQTEPYTYTAYYWVEYNRCVYSMFDFDNDVVNIKSLRPNVLAFPVNKQTKIDTSLTNFE